MLRGQGVHRVAARVAGTQSDVSNRHTDGRIDLARLVGGGPDAPLRMGALRILASTECGATTNSCAACPLQPWCASSSPIEPTESTVSSG